MEQFTYKIKDAVGIHARPAGLLVKLVKSLDGAVVIEKGDKAVDATKLMAIMGMGVKQGDEVTVKADNPDTLAQVQKFFEENL